MATEPGLQPAAEMRASDGDDAALSAAPLACEEGRVRMEEGLGIEARVGESENALVEGELGGGVRVDEAHLQREEGEERVGDDIKSGEKPPLPKRSGGNVAGAKPVHRADHNASGRSSRHNFNPSNPLYRNLDGRPTSGCPSLPFVFLVV